MLSRNRALLSKHRLGSFMDRTQSAKFFSRSVKLFLSSLKLLLASLQKTRSCPALVVSCPEFDVAHPKANCKGNNGDFLSLGKQRLDPHCLLVVVTLFSPGSVSTPAPATTDQGQENWFCNSNQTREFMAGVQSAPLRALISLQKLKQTPLASLKVLS